MDFIRFYFPFFCTYWLMGYNYRLKGLLFHLSHPRDVNGYRSWEGQKANSFFILEQTKYNSSAMCILFCINSLTGDAIGYY